MPFFPLCHDIGPQSSFSFLLFPDVIQFTSVIGFFGFAFPFSHQGRAGTRGCKVGRPPKALHRQDETIIFYCAVTYVVLAFIFSVVHAVF